MLTIPVSADDKTLHYINECVNSCVYVRDLARLCEHKNTIFLLSLSLVNMIDLKAEIF